MARERDKFAVLHAAARIWAVAAIHGEANRLVRLHDALAERWRDGDRLVYLGNLLGRGGQVHDTLEEILDFRRRLLARPLAFLFDIAYLRGAQEEMWQKLLQLQFAPNPRQVFEWMMHQGVDATLAAYGGDVRQGLASTREGALSMTRWTGNLRGAMRAHPGHYELMAALRRAAYTDDRRLLFVSAGIDPARPFSEQIDSFWWGSAGFDQLDHAYDGFARVVRGYDPAHGGLADGPFSTTIDAGCGLGGPLVATCFLPGGDVDDLIEA